VLDASKMFENQQFLDLIEQLETVCAEKEEVKEKDMGKSTSYDENMITQYLQTAFLTLICSMMH
jgi:hypothetical protein